MVLWQCWLDPAVKIPARGYDGIGRHARFKISCLCGRGGSTPPTPTTEPGSSLCIALKTTAHSPKVVTNNDWRQIYTYQLPDELIAQRPKQRRGTSLLVDATSVDLPVVPISAFPTMLEKGDLLVVNDTKVMAARLQGRRQSTGGACELLINNISDTAGEALVKLRKAKSGDLIELDGSTHHIALGTKLAPGRFEVQASAPLHGILEEVGRVPLPPYIRRRSDVEDAKAYQNIYARGTPESAAAPTAGLHFSQEMLDATQQRGIEISQLRLRIGSGTFAPIRADSLEEHEMHAEQLCIPAATQRAIAETKARGGKVVAVGTTVVRALETYAQDTDFRAESDTDFTVSTTLFIRPGFQFRCVDKLLTNFHLPESSLLVLVATFAGLENVLAAYQKAIDKRLKFFSYGDAVLLERI